MKFFKRLTIIAGLLALFTAPVNAYDGAILKGIEVDSPYGQNYRVIIKTTKDVPIKKHITAQNKVVLELENIQPAQYVNTRYNNATEIDHVIVQPQSGNKLRIFLQGLNVAGSKILLDSRDEAISLLPESVISKPKTKPKAEVISDSVFIDLSDKSVDKIKSVTPVATSYTPIEENPVQTNKLFEASLFDWVLRFLALGVIIAAGIKLFAKPKNVEIKLSSEDRMKSREIELLKAAESKKELLTKSIGIGQQHKKQPNASVSQYGLREYQNSQLPPRKMTATPPQKPQRPALKPKAATQQTAVKQPVQQKVTKQQTQQAKENFDGTKFLETMASIYQKSGREDLATGIRQNMTRKQAT